MIISIEFSVLIIHISCKLLYNVRTEANGYSVLNQTTLDCTVARYDMYRLLYSISGVLNRQKQT